MICPKCKAPLTDTDNESIQNFGVCQECSKHRGELAVATAIQMFKDGYRTHQVQRRIVLLGFTVEESSAIVKTVNQAGHGLNTDALQTPYR